MKKRLHEAISRRLRREILADYQAGQHLPSESTLAKRFKVSMVTLRNATQALEEEGFVRRISGVGVVVSERRKQGTIALVSREITVLPRPLYFHLRFDPLLRGEFFRAGWRITSYLQQLGTKPSMDGLDDLREALAQSRHSALIWSPGRPTEDILHLAAGNDTPVFDARHALDCVDYEQMIHGGIEHLYGQGCRRIAGLFSASSPEWQEPYAENIADLFAACLREHGLQVDPRWIIQHSEAWQSGSGWQGFRDLWSASNARPDGLLILDDFLYRDAARAILELGIRIPDQIRIVTHSNRGDDLVHPFPVSLLEVDPVSVATETANRIISALECRSFQEKRIRARLRPTAAPATLTRTQA